MRHLAFALFVPACLAFAGCSSDIVDNAISEAGKVVAFINQPSTQQAIAAVEAGGQKFVCAAASAQAAALAEEKANDEGQTIQSDGQWFYFGSSITCALLGGNVQQVASSTATPTAATTAMKTRRGIRYYRYEWHRAS